MREREFAAMALDAIALDDGVFTGLLGKLIGEAKHLQVKGEALARRSDRKLRRVVSAALSLLFVMNRLDILIARQARLLADEASSPDCAPFQFCAELPPSCVAPYRITTRSSFPRRTVRCAMSWTSFKSTGGSLERSGELCGTERQALRFHLKHHGSERL